MVAWCFSVHSSSALCVLGVARLISSARTTWAMIGPGRNSNSWVFWLKIERPVTSEGSRSGVNWMRRKVQPMLLLRALASMVLPTPGTSSMRMWPSHSKATRAMRTSACLPTMTCSTLATTRSAGSWTFFTSAAPLWASREAGCSLTHNTAGCYRPVQPASARSALPADQLEPLGHDLASDRGCQGRSATAALDDDRHRDRRRRSLLCGCEADEPRVWRQAGAPLRGAGLAGGRDAAESVQGDCALPGIDAANRALHRIDHERPHLGCDRRRDSRLAPAAAIGLEHHRGRSVRRADRVNSEVPHHVGTRHDPIIGAGGRNERHLHRRDLHGR